MAKRRRLGPARLAEAPQGGSEGLSGPFGRPPIADVAGDASTQAAFQEMEETLRTARDEGLLIRKLPIDQIDESYLVRDRIAVDPEEARALSESLAARGQQVPVEVSALGDGRWGLISGWRRLSALRTLGAETILAVERRPADSSDAYLAMVEENEVRVGLNFYERGRIAARAADMGVYPSDPEAIKGLFPTAPRSRRSKIGSFVRIVRALDHVLRFPSVFSETSGLALAKAMDMYPGLAAAICEKLTDTPAEIAEQEQAFIQEVIGKVEAKSVAKRVDPSKGGRPKKAPPEVVDLTAGLTAHIHHDDGRIVLTGPALHTEDGRDDVIRRLQD